MSCCDCGPIEAFADGRCHVVRAGRRQIGIARWGDRLYAINNVCAHQRGPLCRGPVLSTVTAAAPGAMDLHAEAPVIACPWHGWEFDLRTGRAVSDPRYRVRTFPVRVEAGRVLVELDPTTARGRGK